jgi:flagellar biosynthesis protein FlhF
MLKASVHAYGGARLQGSILTKLDETASMGEALGVVMQNRLPIVYTTDGQDIPKNIDVARAQQLVAKAVGLLKSKADPVASRV